MTAAKSVHAGQHEIFIRGDLANFEVALTAREIEPGVALVELRLVAPESREIPEFDLFWTRASVDIHATREPTTGCNRSLRIDWGRPFKSRATSGSQVVCLHSSSGKNRLTFACSEVLRPVHVKAAVHEETGEFHCSLGFFHEAHPPVANYEISVRIDTREAPYAKAVRDVSDWWSALPHCVPSSVLDNARLPMYSTWYSFHQALTADGIKSECRLAKELGCEAVIVDDGWQTLESSRGYAFCGDWKPERLPEMRAHVARVHALGMKYILWYLVLFIGEKSEAFERFKGRYLEHVPRNGAWILDPRHPKVRDYLIEIYERAMREWDLDGFKLDFVDAFPSIKTQPQHAPEQHDCASVEEGIDRLLGDVMMRLRRIKPDAMIGFRQSYVGPLMRKYGKMFRVGDCPNDGILNRNGAIDIRLLCGATAAHADMLMWHQDDPVESAALQFLNVLFAVPQLSMMLRNLGNEHLEMVRFWLGFWRTYRDVLLDGELMPLHSELLYPAVIASTPSMRIAASYADFIIAIGTDIPRELFVINATRGDRVVIEVTADAGEFEMTTLNCCGKELLRSRQCLGLGLHALSIPPAGLAILRR